MNQVANTVILPVEEYEALRAQVLSLTKERDEWKDAAVNGGNAGYLRERLAAITENQEPVAFMASSGKVITADDAEMMLKYSASYFHTPLYLHPSFEQRNPALLEIAIQVQYWLDYQERIYGLENTQLNDDSHLYAPPIWPTRGMLKNWVAALTNSQESPAVERCAANPDTIQQEYQWVRDVLAEHGYDGPLAEACCPLREMLASHPEPAPQQEQFRYKFRDRAALEAFIKSNGLEPLMPVCAPPLQDDVAKMVERLRSTEYDDLDACKAADMLERLARQVPEGCVVVPREATQEKITSQEPMLPIG